MKFGGMFDSINHEIAYMRLENNEYGDMSILMVDERGKHIDGGYLITFEKNGDNPVRLVLQPGVRPDLGLAVNEDTKQLNVIT